jgi:hypothetical protein
MQSRILAFVGMILFIVFGVGLSVAYTLAVKSIEPLALSMDGKTNLGVATPCAFINLDITVPRRVLSESDSEIVTIEASNLETVVCTARVHLYAVQFNAVPDERVEEITLQPGESTTVTWIVTPQVIGAYTIAASAGNGNTRIGIAVTNIFGLTSKSLGTLQAIGYFLGIVLMLPLLSELWKSRRAALQTSA